MSDNPDFLLTEVLRATDKQFAVLKVFKNLQLVHFDSRGELLDAIRQFNKRGIQCIAFQLHHGTGLWVQMEIVS